MSERDRVQLQKWLNETESDCESVLGVEEPDEEEENVVIHNSDTYEADSDEDEHSEEEEAAVEPQLPEETLDEEMPEEAEPVLPPQPPHLDLREFYLGREKGKNTEPTRWYLESAFPHTARTPRRNIIPYFHAPGPQGNAKHARTSIEAFACMIDNGMIEHIVHSTNIYIDKIKTNFCRERDAKPTDVTEIKSLLGILYLVGVLHSGRRNVFDLWDLSKGTGCDAVYVTMSEHRFRFLLRCLRFDDVRDRELRRAQDKLAAIRQIFEQFVLNSKSSFKPTDYLTLDEQLVAFRGKCPFRIYMPKKPAKFGIKVYALVSASNFYATNLEVYVGRQLEGQYKVSNKTRDLVLRMVEPVSGSHRNITADNFFSSLPTSQELLKEKKLTFVGTMRKNRPEIPACFLPDKEREPKSSVFGFRENCTLVSYVPEKNKAVCLLSTMHFTGEIDTDTGDDKKPTIITTYNHTKHGVDILDKMIGQYDVSRNSRRWPLTLFFHIMNVAGVNALNIYRANQNYTDVVRKNFLQDLALELMKPAIQRRINLQNVPVEIKRRGKMLLGIVDPPVQPQPKHSSMGRCFLCGRARNKTTRKTCEKCYNWVCPDHQKSICNTCYE